MKLMREGKMECEIDGGLVAESAVMQELYQIIAEKKELRLTKLRIHQSISVPALTCGHDL